MLCDLRTADNAWLQEQFGFPPIRSGTDGRAYMEDCERAPPHFSVHP
jgi:hypothetical protein